MKISSFFSWLRNCHDAYGCVLFIKFQITAETAYDMVSPGPSVRMTKGRRRGKRKLHRPQDIREGVTNAYHIVKDVSDPW